jgi:hypothetical protein
VHETAFYLWLLVFTFGIRKMLHIDGAVFVRQVYNDVMCKVCTVGKYLIQMITVLFSYY